MIQDRYNCLPDGMEAAEVQRYFDELLSEVEGGADLDVVDVTEAFYQLADRHWHTYSLLPSDYKNRIEKWIAEHWLPNSLPFVVNVGFITGCLGLTGILSLLDSESRNPSLDDNVRNEMKSIVKEIGPKIHDPYQGMREHQPRPA